MGVLGDAESIVPDRQEDTVFARGSHLEGELPCLVGALVEGVPGVGQQVDEDLQDLVTVGEDAGCGLKFMDDLKAATP